jgi:hypothetical protein
MCPLLCLPQLITGTEIYLLGLKAGLPDRWDSRVPRVEDNTDVFRRVDFPRFRRSSLNEAGSHSYNSLDTLPNKVPVSFPAHLPQVLPLLTLLTP